MNDKDIGRGGGRIECFGRSYDLPRLGSDEPVDRTIRGHFFNWFNALTTEESSVLHGYASEDYDAYIPAIRSTRPPGDGWMLIEVIPACCDVMRFPIHVADDLF